MVPSQCDGVERCVINIVVQWYLPTILLGVLSIVWQVSDGRMTSANRAVNSVAELSRVRHRMSRNIIGPDAGPSTRSNSAPKLAKFTL